MKNLAVSYSRFSDPKQTTGDSAERQERMFKQFCVSHNLTPSGEAFADRGVSGFRGKNRKKGLGRLIEAAKLGRFERGTIIVVEAWDRLGRQRPDRQLELLSELLRTGVSIGICRLNDTFEEKDFGTHKWTTLSVFVGLAYQESLQKSDRVKGAWKRRRETAAAACAAGSLGKGSLPCQPPAWCEIADYARHSGGTMRLIPQRAAAIRRIFALAGDGYGYNRIIKTLNAEGHKPFQVDGKPGRTVSHLSGRWTRSYLHLLLRDKRVLGCYQPRTKTEDGKIIDDGEPVQNYYPVVIDETTFALAQKRKNGNHKQERQSKYVNIFKGMVADAKDGQNYFLHNGGITGGGLVLLNRSGDNGGKCCSFPYAVFEAAILSLLSELDPRDVLKSDTEERSRTEDLRRQLAAIRADLTNIRADLRERYSKTLTALVRDKEADEERVATALQEELAKSSRPAAQAWKELPDLAALVNQGGDAVRLKVHVLLQRIIAEMRLLIVPRGKDRLAAVQIWFADVERHRDYLILHRPPKSNGKVRVEGSWSVRSLADATQLGPLDLRKKTDARKLEPWLSQLDINLLIGDGERQD